ncbi:TATA box-binding protein-like protein 1 isoform X1 [Acanthaster planci]|uniref:TATA box-binding protein-like 1 n=1 Tax=Acanthaster planci TaxID=133434 RepID=A0A8B7Y8F6_ACAPL|nr:TATA box-binding protein-like protein 1 isoform X1 [Acanthaster planci]XP_022089508.1 TATA box-binding protein-like protein 1 isoform X2 [Acanthaster planci]XP_022089509.1 TATA box-binding protein-like protein 1 isoform X1 [Acanthaster planci]
MAGAEADAATLLLEGANSTTSFEGGNSLTHDLQANNTFVNPDVVAPAHVDEQQNGENGVDATPSIDIFINNVVCTFGVRCHLNLKKIGMEGVNVEYRREYGKVNMRFRNPAATCTIWSSGRVSITGNSSEEDAKKTARRCARALQKMGFRVRFCNFQVVNVLGTCSMPFGIKIAQFAMQHPRAASYEPELHPAVTYKLKSPRATLKVFSTGSITVTAPCVENISLAIQHIYPLVEPHATPLREEVALKRKMKSAKRRKRRKVDDSEDDDYDDDLEDDDDFDNVDSANDDDSGDDSDEDSDDL